MSASNFLKKKARPKKGVKNNLELQMMQIKAIQESHSLLQKEIKSREKLKQEIEQLKTEVRQLKDESTKQSNICIGAKE